MLELLKNSMRATMDWHGVDGDIPPIKVVIADGQDNEDVVIKVSDEGGGIPRSNMKKIWSYLFTTGDPAVQQGMVAISQDDQDHRYVLAVLTARECVYSGHCVSVY
jgi:pyruvate dehydrogenase kinase 2/3/4